MGYIKGIGVIILKDYLAGAFGDDRTVNIDYYFCYDCNKCGKKIKEKDEEYSHNTTLGKIRSEMGGNNPDSHYSQYGFIYDLELGNNGLIDVRLSEMAEGIDVQIIEICEKQICDDCKNN